MTSYEASQLFSTLKNALSSPNLSLLLGRCNRFNSQLKAEFHNLLQEQSSDTLWAAKTELQRFTIEAVTPNIKEIRSRAVFTDINKIESELLRLKNDLPEQAVSPVMYLLSLLQAFSGAYEEFLHSTSTETALDVLDSSESLSAAMLNFTDLAGLMMDVLQHKQPIKNGYDEISIVLSSTPRYKQVLIKLSALESIYTELCNLMGISSSEFPLEVGKVEVGSLWLKLFGESRIISILTKLLESSAAFLYRNYTNEGKVQAIPRQVESIEAVIHLSQQLEAMGIDTSQIKENLEKSAVTISNKLNDLLLGEPSIKINEKELSVGQSLDEKFLSESRGLFLESGDEEESSKQ